MTRQIRRTPTTLRGMLPSLCAFGILSAATAGVVTVSTDAEHDAAMSRVNVALQSCPDVREMAEAIAQKREPTQADAARIVAMGRRAAGHVEGCRGLMREPSPPGSLIEEGYWLADRTMQIADYCPAVRSRTNAMFEDGVLNLREASAVAMAAKAACPSIVLNRKTR